MIEMQRSSFVTYASNSAIRACNVSSVLGLHARDAVTQYWATHVGTALPSTLYATRLSEGSA